ncbi:hypothetical protein D3C80_1570580 [compost metagenome]
MACLALSLLLEEPRTAGMPRRATALVKNSPSGLSETSPLIGCARFIGQLAGPSASRECQKAHSTPPPSAQTSSATCSFSCVQRMVA